jgi:hypothetical protein
MRHPSASMVWPCVLASALCFGSYAETMAGDPAGSLPGTFDPFALGGLAPAPSPPQFDDREGLQLDTALQDNPWPSGPGPVQESPFGVIRASIFAKTNPAAWRPLPLRTLFREGWNEPWIEPPGGSKGAPRQGWINAADGNFYRNWFFVYAFSHKRINGGNGHLGQYVLYAPLNRRLGLIINVPFIVVNGTASRSSVFPPSLGAPGVTRGSGFGDITFTPRVMLFEAQGTALSAQLSIRTPTGSARSGDGGRASLTPQLQLWRNVADKWVVRGGFGVTAPTNHAAGNGPTLISQLAVGQTLLPHEKTPLGDFTYYVSANVLNAFGSSLSTFVSLTPGFRTYLGKGWYLLGGLEVPVTIRPPFREQLIFFLVKSY